MNTAASNSQQVFVARLHFMWARIATHLVEFCGR